MVWAKVNGDTGAVNLRRIAALGVDDLGGGSFGIAYFTDASLISGTVTGHLDGTWTSSAGAQEAIKELVDAVDPATYGD